MFPLDVKFYVSARHIRANIANSK